MTLTALLREELATTERLEQFLRREYDALKSRDLVGLEQIVTEKQTCVDRLRGLIADRLAYLRERGASADAPGLAAQVDALPSPERDETSGLWAALERAAERVRTQNEVNGTVIAASRNHVERMLAILRGRDSLDFLYDHDTRKVFGGGSQPIAKA